MAGGVSFSNKNLAFSGLQLQAMMTAIGRAAAVVKRVISFGIHQVCEALQHADEFSFSNFCLY